MIYRCTLRVTPKVGIRDPEGEAVAESLRGMGYADFEVDHVGRLLTLEITAPSEDQARALIDDMCKRLLVNPNLERYDVAIESER